MMVKIKQSSRRARRWTGGAALAALVVGGVAGAQALAGDEGGGGSPPPPGQPVEIEVPDEEFPTGGDDNLIQTSGSTFDETVVTKFIPASAFDPYQGDPASFEDDKLQFTGGCVRPLTGIAGTGSLLEMRAPVELPDGARIKNVTFFGVDDAATDISVTLIREEFVGFLAISPLPPTFSRTTPVTVDSFSTAGVSGEVAVAGADDLDELVGTPASGGIFLGFPHRFHTISVNMSNSAGLDHLLCGVEVQYQVAKSSADAGTVFHPLDPVRAFDSRRATYPAAGLLAPNDSKVVSVANGYDAAGVAIPAQANVVPANATAITYNVTVAGATGSNFVAVTAGDAASFTASAINFNAGSNVANAATVSIAADRTIKLWGGNGPGSAHVLIDVTGYYAPAPPVSNMAG
jgi:hypothetical protein